MLEKRDFKFYFSRTMVHAIMFGLMCACVLPFVMVISTSLTSVEGIRTWGYTLFPRGISAKAYTYIFANPKQILDSYCLTVFVTACGTICGMFLMTTFAYTISREDYKFKKILSFYIYFTMLFNGGMVANYILMTRFLGLQDNRLSLILPLMMNAWNVLILRIFCKSIPNSLIESAKIEGANEFKIFFSIVIPLAKTGIATIMLLLVFTYWNDWFLSMMYMDTSKDVTLQYYLVKILNNVEFIKANETNSGGMLARLNVPDESVRMALCVIAAGPMTVLFPFFQKYFVKGLVVGSVKG